MLLLSVTAGCSIPVPRTFPIDQSFLTGEPCAAPCWYGLKLDEATQETILSTLRGNELVDESSIRIYDNSVWPQFPTASEVYFCSKSEKHHCNTAVLSQGKLKMLWLSVQYDLTLKEIVQRLGEPDYISYAPYHPETRGCTLALYWPKSRLFVENVSETDDSVCQALSAGKGINPNIKVTGMVYAVSEAFGPGLTAGWPYAAWPGFIVQ